MVSIAAFQAVDPGSIPGRIGMLCTHKTNLPNLNYLYAKFIQDANKESTVMETLVELKALTLTVKAVEQVSAIITSAL